MHVSPQSVCDHRTYRNDTNVTMERENTKIQKYNLYKSVALLGFHSQKSFAKKICFTCLQKLHHLDVT